MAARRAALRKELKDIEAQIDRLYTAIAEGTITDTTMLRGKLDQSTPGAMNVSHWTRGLEWTSRICAKLFPGNKPPL